jgi:hypothetical protein
MHLVKASLLCFRYVALPSIAITLFTSYLLWQSGHAWFVVGLIWTKVITTGLLLAFVHFFRSRDFIFFHNIGFTTLSIYLAMVMPDFLLAALVYYSVILLL